MLRNGLKRLVDKSPHLFRTATPDQLSSFLSDLGPERDDIVTPIRREIFLHQAVSIDIESDGERLFQIGYAQGSEARLIEVNDSGVTVEDACRPSRSTCRGIPSTAWW